MHSSLSLQPLPLGPAFPLPTSKPSLFPDKPAWTPLTPWHPWMSYKQPFGSQPVNLLQLTFYSLSCTLSPR